MLGIRDVEIINKDDLNHSKRSYKKKQILLYDTKRRIDDFVKKIKFRNDSNQYDKRKKKNSKVFSVEFLSA